MTFKYLMTAAAATATLWGAARQLPEPQTTGGKPLMEAIADHLYAHYPEFNAVRENIRG